MTTIYFVSTVPDWSRGQGDGDILGTTRNWTQQGFSLSRGSGVTSQTRTSVLGTTTGIEAGTSFEWISNPLDADVTISGTITPNLWGIESAMTANAGIACIIQRLDSQGAVASTVSNTGVIGAEMDTAASARTSGFTPTSTDFLKGDRIRARVYFKDAGGTMASGATLTFRYNGSGSGADGDSYISFTEDFGFLVDAPGTDPSYAGTGLQPTFGTTAIQRLAQRFTAPDSGTLTSITVNLNKTGTPADNVEVALQAESSGAPSGSDLSAAASLAGGTITGTATDYAFDIGDYALTGGTRYWLVVRRSGSMDAANNYAAKMNLNPGYAGGVAKYYDGSVWTNHSAGLYFTTSVTNAFSTLYLTDTASAVDPNGASYDAFEAWTSRGGSAVGISKFTSSVVGPTAPLQARMSAAGNFIEWFTKQLTGFTLSGLINVNAWVAEVNAGDNAAVRCEIAVCASDGTSPVVWGASNDGTEMPTTTLVSTFMVAGDDTTVTDGQRLRIRFYFDDAPGVAMGTTGGASNLGITYSRSSAGVAGDTYITLPQTVTEFSSGPVTNALQTVGGKGMMQAIYPTATG